MQRTKKQTALISEQNPEQWSYSFLTSASFVHFLNLMPEAAILSTTSGQVILTNTTAQQLFQYSEQEFLQCVVEDLVPEKIKAIHPKLRASFFDNPEPRFLTGRNLELTARKKDNTLFPMESALFAIQTDQGAIAVNLIRDISDQQQQTKKITEYAFVDTLTNLPNRRYFDDNLQRQLARSERCQESLGLLYIDLDVFKPINDTHGHMSGDLILQTISSRLSELTRTEDVLARVGGDEFILTIFPVPDPLYLTTIAERVLQACSQPITIGNHTHQVFASIGISISASQYSTQEQLTHAADQAMYQAKQQGGNCFVYAKSEKTS